LKTFLSPFVLLFLVLAGPLAGKGHKEDSELEVLFSSAQALSRQGEFEQAIVVFQNILEQDQRHVGALNGLADILLRSGEQSKAVEYYRKAMDLDFRDIHARHQLAQIYRNDNLHSEASRLLEQLILYHPDNLEIALELAKLQAEMGRTDDSRLTLLNAVRATKDCENCDRLLRADLYFALALLEQEASAWKMHSEYILSTLVENPLHNDALLQATRIAIEERRYDDAKAHFGVMLTESPVLRPNVQTILNILPFPAGPAVLVPVCYEDGEADFGEKLLSASIAQAERMQRQDWVSRFERMRQSHETQ
jgi:tetratricopeptide (TPR) repeat protein